MLDFLNRRRTIRRYADRPIDPALLDRLLEAACRASNTGNMQAYSVVVTTDPAIKAAVDFITGEEMLKVGCEENLTRLKNELINKDWFMTLLDFDSYKETKEKALAAYADRKTWAKMMLVNIAEAGFFSSDRTIGEYNKDIWKLQEEK